MKLWSSEVLWGHPSSILITIWYDRNSCALDLKEHAISQVPLSPVLTGYFNPQSKIVIIPPHLRHWSLQALPNLRTMCLVSCWAGFQQQKVPRVFQGDYLRLDCGERHPRHAKDNPSTAPTKIHIVSLPLNWNPKQSVFGGWFKS